jgi:2-iminoacetate synthase
VEDQISSVDAFQVQRVLNMDKIPAFAAPVLFSKAARPFLEIMAKRARSITRARFGRCMTIYAPVYLSNYCNNRCAYCGFAAGQTISRIKLSMQQTLEQVEYLLAEGIQHLLLVTGEAPDEFGLDQLCAVAKRLRGQVASLSVEVFPCHLAGYLRLVEAGVDGLVLYQETYDPQVYRTQHLAGPKRLFEKRLLSVEEGGQAGMRSLGIGSLLGLANPQVEACFLAWHGDYLTRRFPGSRLSLSFPRLRPVPGGTPVLFPVSDADLVQFIVGMRLMFPDAELVLSTREPADLRDKLLPLGITRLSAGSKTSPGGYGPHKDKEQPEQFQVEDSRSVQEIIGAVRSAGFDVVFKDFDAAFVQDEG